VTTHHGTGPLSCCRSHGTRVRGTRSFAGTFMFCRACTRPRVEDGVHVRKTLRTASIAAPSLVFLFASSLRYRVRNPCNRRDESSSMPSQIFVRLSTLGCVGCRSAFAAVPSVVVALAVVVGAAVGAAVGADVGAGVV